MVTRAALVQQGYEDSPQRLRELSWGLRFTPLVCMAGAIVGLVLQEPAIHLALAALGILPFWTPAWHPIDRLYNHLLRPLWGGVVLPPNPLPRRIACMMGGAMNLAIAASFIAGRPTLAYVFGGVLVALQLLVITTHVCVASILWEQLLRLAGRFTPPLPVDEAFELLASGAELIDVREPHEFAEGHLPGARNVPMSEVVERLASSPPRALLLYCRSGFRSRRARGLLERTGRTEVYDVGGIDRLRRRLNGAAGESG